MAEPAVTAIFHRPFAEQVAAWRLRLGNRLPTTRWDDLRHEAHDRGFMVAGAMKADLLSDLAAAVDKAVADGGTLEAFRGDFRKIVARHGWHGWTGEGTKAGEAWRTKVIYRTNMATSHAAGRLAQLKAGGFTYWIYRHSGAEHPRLDHKSWDRLVLPADHPFWEQHSPPNGWGCGCKIYGAHSPAGARRRGGDPDKPLPDTWDEVDPRTGAQRGIGKGWGYAPGASVVQTVQLGADIIRRQPAEIGSLLGADLAPMVARAWPMWLADTLARGSHRDGLVGTMSPRLVDLLGRRGIAPASAEIMLKPGLIVGPKARRHEDKGDALSLAEWLMLPRLMLEPYRTLLDTQSGKVLLLLGEHQSDLQLALDLTYRPRGGSSLLQNTIVSAYHPSERDLLGRLATRQIIDLEDEDAG